MTTQSLTLQFVLLAASTLSHINMYTCIVSIPKRLLDANPDRDTTEQFQMLNRAYEVLKDPKLKKSYDVFGSKGIGTSASSDVDNLKREQARSQRRPTPNNNRPPNPAWTGSSSRSSSTNYNYYSGNPDVGSGWPSGTESRSPFAQNSGPQGTRSASVDTTAGAAGSTSASRSSGPSSSSGRARVSDPSPVGGVRSQSAGPKRTTPGTNGPNFSDHDTFRVDKSIFESTARSSTRPSGSTRQRASTTSSQEFQTGPKPNDSTAYYGDMGTVHAQSGSGYSDSSMFIPQDGVAFTSGEAFFGRGPKFGRDVLMDVEIDVKTANSGGKKWIEVRHMEKCTKCQGVGTKDPSRCKVSQCPKCGGSGHTMNASQKRETCSTCLGTGRITSNPCDSCGGLGLEEAIKSVQIVIPKDVNDGFTMRIPGQGDAGPNGGPAGDLYVCFSIPEMRQKKAVSVPEKKAPRKTVVLNNHNTYTGPTRTATTTTNIRPQPMSTQTISPQVATSASQDFVSPSLESNKEAVEDTTPLPSTPQKRRGIRGFFGGFVSRVMRK